jgi:hypothetical protein
VKAESGASLAYYTEGFRNNSWLGDRHLHHSAHHPCRGAPDVTCSAERIKQLMFTFDNLIRVDAGEIIIAGSGADDKLVF